MSNEATASAMRRMNPVRMEHAFFSDLNPWMWWVKPMAEAVRADRRPAAKDNPCSRSSAAAEADREALDQYRDAARRPRRARLQGDLRVPGAARWRSARIRRRPGAAAPADRPGSVKSSRALKRKELEASLESGTPVDAWARLLALRPPRRPPVDERPFNMVRRMIDELKPENSPSLAALKAAVKRQAFVLALDAERAIAALPKLAPDRAMLRRGFDAARAVVSARGEMTAEQQNGTVATSRPTAWGRRVPEHGLDGRGSVH